MQDIVLKAMQEHREKTRKIVEQVIDAESSFLYTTDTDYLIKRGAFIQKQDARDNTRVQDPNKVLANELRYRIDSYFNLVCRNVRDSVPKIIGTFLVRACQVIQKIIIKTLNSFRMILSSLCMMPLISMMNL